MDTTIGPDAARTPNQPRWTSTFTHSFGCLRRPEHTTKNDRGAAPRDPISTCERTHTATRTMTTRRCLASTPRAIRSNSARRLDMKRHTAPLYLGNNMPRKRQSPHLARLHTNDTRECHTLPLSVARITFRRALITNTNKAYETGHNAVRARTQTHTPRRNNVRVGRKIDKLGVCLESRALRRRDDLNGHKKP